MDGPRAFASLKDHHPDRNTKNKEGTNDDKEDMVCRRARGRYVREPGFRPPVAESFRHATGLRKRLQQIRGMPKAVPVLCVYQQHHRRLPAGRTTASS